MYPDTDDDRDLSRSSASAIASASDAARAAARTASSPTALALRKLRRTVEFRTPDVFHRFIALAPLAYAGWCFATGTALPPLFWWLVVITILFHLLVKCTAYVRLTPVGLSFPQEGDSREVRWEELREARNTEHSMNLLLGTGEQVRIDYRKMRSRDVKRLRQIIRLQCQALADEAQAALERGEVFGRGA
jgi:hypothetical protein